MKPLLVALLLFSSSVMAKTPKLNISLSHGSREEQSRKEQIERLATQYDLENTR